jgi:hypothetical protein
MHYMAISGIQSGCLQACKSGFNAGMDWEAAMTKLDSGGTATAATHDEITSILGEIDQAKLLEIISLQPTIADIEHALLWLSGDTDVFGADEPVKGKASDIVTILTEDEEEERPPAA